MTRSWRGLAVGLLLWVPSVFASASPPGTLRDLVPSSQLIVLARVESERQRPGTDAELNLEQTVAHLRILEVWKGPSLSELDVRYLAHKGGPTPPVYTVGRTVIAFLQRDAGDAEWSTVRLSHGTRYPSNARGLADYRQVVRETAAYEQTARNSPSGGLGVTFSAPYGMRLQTPGVPGFALDEVEWGVRVAVRPDTRWDGLHQLMAPAAARQQARLTPKQLDRLAQAFVQDPVADFTITMMLRVLGDHPSREVDAMAAVLLETAMGEQRLPLWAGDAVELLRMRLEGTLAFIANVAPVTVTAADLAKPDFDYAKWRAAYEQKVRQQWESVKKKHGLAPRPLDLPVSGSGGAGDDTPP